MAITKHIAIITFALAVTNAHALGENHGARAAIHGGGSSSAGQSAASAGSTGANSGMGGRYYAEHYLQDPADPYQPWPQSEVRQFAKARWEPYAGD